MKPRPSGDTPARQDGARMPRTGKLLLLVAVFLLPFLVLVAFQRVPTQSELAQLSAGASSPLRDRDRRLHLPVRIQRPLTRRVILIVLDAWQRSIALDDQKMPKMAALAQRGSRGTMLTGVRTLTKPCVRKLMTGLYSNVQDSALNLVSDPVAEESLLSRLNAAGYAYTLVDATPAFSGLFERQSRPGSVLTPLSQGVAWDPEDPAHDALVEAATLPLLYDPSQRFLMIHFEDLDLAGHIYGPGSEAYDRVLRASDDRIARLVPALDLRRDTLIVMGDHGSDSRGHHGGADALARQTAYVAVGAGIKNSNRPWDPLDVSDTLAMLLGLCPPLDSIGAPNPEILALGGQELKLRCDRCLLDRLATLAGPTSQWTSTAEAERYFGAAAFTPGVADLYRRVASPLQETRLPWRVLALAIATTALSLLLLWYSRIETRANAVLITVFAALAFLPSRDLVCVAFLAGLLAFASLADFRPTNLLGMSAAAALMASPFFAAPTPVLYAAAGYAGTAIWLAGCCALTLLILRQSRIRSIGPMALTALSASIAAHFIPSHNIPGDFSFSVALLDYALAAGVVFLTVGLTRRDQTLTAVASTALAGCLFHGWPLLILVLIELFLQFRPPQARGVLVRSLVWAPVGVIALLRAGNGGYGFSKIDLSLAALGVREDALNYGWAAVVIFLAYVVPLLLALRLALAMTRRPLVFNLEVLLNVLLLFCGADLLFVAAPGLDQWGSGAYEETLVFDIVLCALIGLALSGAAAGAFLRRVWPVRIDLEARASGRRIQIAKMVRRA